MSYPTPSDWWNDWVCHGPLPDTDLGAAPWATSCGGNVVRLPPALSWHNARGPGVYQNQWWDLDQEHHRPHWYVCFVCQLSFVYLFIYVYFSADFRCTHLTKHCYTSPLGPDKSMKIRKSGLFTTTYEPVNEQEVIRDEPPHPTHIAIGTRILAKLSYMSNKFSPCVITSINGNRGTQDNWYS